MATALIDLNFKSQTLGMQSELRLLVPQGESPPSGWPVLWLYHGLSDDHTVWTRKTSIERYVWDLGLAVVMPNAHRSFYTNMAHGLPYFDFIADEIPQICYNLFPLSRERSSNFTAGLSMGGYGAFKIALTHPERYAAAASLSGALHISALSKIQDQPARVEEMENIFGPLDKVTGSQHDLVELCRRAPRPVPALYQCCGVEDYLYESNIEFRDSVKNLSDVRLTYAEGPGEHNWDYWDLMIQEVLRWLPLPNH